LTKKSNGRNVGDSNNVSARFSSAVLEAVDEALLALGEHVRQAIYWHLEKKRSISRDEIPDKLKDFASALSDLCGAGGKVLENIIVKRLYSKLGLPFKELDRYDFNAYIEEAKRRIK